MKFIFSLLLFALIAPAQALGVPYELFLYQTLPSGSGFFGRYVAPLAPTPNTSAVFMYDGATTLPQLGYIGSGLSWDGTTLSAAAMSINDAPGRALVTSTSATGFQISSGRNARACYEGSFATTSTIGGAASVTVFLETADTNSTTPADWTTKARQTYSNTITLAVVLQQVQGNNWSMCRDIPAGKFVRIRSGSVSGTASATINTEQQETLL
jgi:hypothetical protein